MRRIFLLASIGLGIITSMGYNWISIAIFRLISILQASTLRDRYYTSINRIEVLETAIEDIERINANSADPNALISGICFRIKQD